MNLTQELRALREAAVKGHMMDVIGQAIASSNTVGMSYDEAVAMLVKKVMDQDVDGMFTDKASTEEAVRDMFEPDDLHEATEDDGNWPKLIAHADEYRVEMDEDEQCHLFDGTGTIKVSMPLVIWKQLTR